MSYLLLENLPNALKLENINSERKLKWKAFGSQNDEMRYFDIYINCLHL